MTDVSIVVPCFNEALRLDCNRFLRFSWRHPQIRFVFVDDGSSDDTCAILQKLQSKNPAQFDLISLAFNQGKAEAVRSGILHALDQRPAAVGYWDADLATPLESIPQMLAVLDRRKNVDIVFGSRLSLVGRQINRKRWRQKMGRLFSIAASRVLGLSIRDTQCGAKMIRASASTRKIFADRFSSGWIFDVEMFARWRACVGKQRNGSIYEYPLDEWRDIQGSKLRSVDFFNAALQLAGIFWRYRIAGWQPTASEPESVLTPPHPNANPGIEAGETSASAA